MNQASLFDGPVVHPDFWEIRLDGRTVCQSHIPWLGFSTRLLLEQLAYGYNIYKNGKRLSRKEVQQR